VRSGFKSQAGYRSPVRAPGGARGSDGNRQTWLPQKKPLARSTRVSRTQWPLGEFGRPAALWTRSFLVRGQDGQPRRCARPAAPPSYGGRPGSTPGIGSHALVAESGRRASPRCWWSARAVPVQVRAGAPCRRARLRPRSCKAGGSARHRTAAHGGRLLCRQGRRRLERRNDAGPSPARPAHAFRIGVRSPLVWACSPGRHRGKAPRGCSSAGRAQRSQRWGRGFEARRPLHVTVVSAVSTRPRQGFRAGSNPVGHS
jgi:hypothetical protein